MRNNRSKNHVLVGIVRRKQAIHPENADKYPRTTDATYQVDDDIAAKLLAILDGKINHAHGSSGVVSIDMEDRCVDALMSQTTK